MLMEHIEEAKTSPSDLCHFPTTFHGVIFSAIRSQLTQYVLAAKAPSGSLIALIKTEDTIKKILSAMGLPTEAPKPHPARPPPSEPGHGGEWLN
jgi:hypothetical protein